MSEESDFLKRRALVTGAAMLGAGLAAAPAMGQPKGGASGWAPVKETADAWLDVPSSHRFAFDSMSPEGAGAAMSFMRTYYVQSKEGYGLDPTSLAVVLILRAGSTPAGYNDAMWAKYGTLLGPAIKLTDPVTGAAPVRNIFNTRGVSAPGANGVLLSELLQRGTQFAVCGSATTGLSELLARNTGGQAQTIRAELAANLVPGARLVPAGIVTLNRVQEHGYAVAQLG